MSLYSSIQLANNSLRATQIGLQVTGQNIANANTPGYIREEVIFSPSDTQRTGGLLLGLGVEVTAVIQKIDNFLENRLRNATSDRASAEAQEDAYAQLEGVIGELNDTDLSTHLSNFFNSIDEVLNQPESVATRNLAVLQGKTLTSEVQRLSSRVQGMYADFNDRVVVAADQINKLTTEIHTLNQRIAAIEGGTSSQSDAVGLRDQRLNALSALSSITDIQVTEENSGVVSVRVGGDYLVLEGQKREVKVEYTSERGLAVATVKIAATDSALESKTGSLSGLISARDNVFGTFLDDLDDFASSMIYEFNKVYSSGQGLSGYSSVTSEFAVTNVKADLDAAGLRFTPSSGAFDMLVYDRSTGLSKTTTIQVDLNGIDEDTSLEDIAAAIDAVDGINATVTADRRLKFGADDSNKTFAFGNDTSGLLASLGVNTFFSGTTASDIRINSIVSNDATKFAASQGGVGEDTSNAIALAAFLDKPIASQGNQSLTYVYDRMISKTTHGATVTKSVAEGFRVFEDSLASQKMATSGVSLDEEAVRLITYQRTFQASARYISVLSELLELLVNL